MPTHKQTTVFLENKPGRLAHVLSALAQAKINIVALAVMDRSENGVLRLVTEDAPATRKTLGALNLQASENDVLAVELLPNGAPIADPLGADLGTQRVLRTSPLTGVPAIC